MFDYKGTLAGILHIIGFVPKWPFSKEAENALYEISYKRNMIVVKNFSIGKNKAELLLSKHIKI